MSFKVEGCGAWEHIPCLQAIRRDLSSAAMVAAKDEEDWQQEYFGDNYPRLARIKKEVDPDDVLWCHPCVGNEGWKEVGKKLCRV